jgi:NodT family efflux transporter outer membrane factor (OMF) lipoprotein
MLVLAACAVGPDFQAPAPPAAMNFTKAPLPEATESAPIAGGEAQHFAADADIPGNWWTLFHSQQLDALVADALKANPTLEAAQNALRVAMENVRAQQGAFYPAVTGSFAASRNKNAEVLAPTLSSNELLFNLYQAQLAVSWAPDIFGGNRRQVEALRAQAEAQRLQLRATYIALSANVVAAAVQEASLRDQIAAAQEVIRNVGDALAIIRRQNALGQIAGADVAAEEAALAQAQQALPSLEKQLAQQRDLLTALAGRLSADEIDEAFELSDLELPRELPVSLPSKLVQRRPDIMIAEQNLHAASAEVGVAIAAEFPSITLTAADGSVATKLGSLFGAGGGFWALGAGLTQPIFQGGTLLHRTRAAEAAYDQAASVYRSTVVTAFQNVADTLHALAYDAETLKAAVATETAASRSLEIARRQVELGQSQYLALLTAQQAYQQALSNRVQAQASRYADTAALFQALGGGWWNNAELLAGSAAKELER